MTGPLPAGGYPSIELGQPGKPVCPDQFTAASTVFCAGATKLRVQTSVAAIFVQFAVLDGATLLWDINEQPILPSVGSIPRRFDAIRARNYIAGEPAQILLTPTP